MQRLMERLLGWIDLTVLKRGLLCFWAIWLSIVTLTNLLNALQVIGALPASFQFTSGNYQWINSVMDPLAVPRGLQGFLFAGVIGWELICAVLFWAAVGAYRNRSLTEERVTLWACALNLALWSAFQALDEVFLAYQPEAVHRVIFGNQLLTVLFLAVLTHPARVDSSRAAATQDEGQM
jgi:hypothetical protein